MGPFNGKHKAIRKGPPRNGEMGINFNPALDRANKIEFAAGTTHVNDVILFSKLTPEGPISDPEGPLTINGVDAPGNALNNAD